VPQAQPEEHVAEPARSLDPHRLQPHLLDVRELVLARLEQTRVHPPTSQLVRIRLRTAPPLRVQLAQARDDFLPDLAADAHRSHQQPVGVRLAVLPDALVAEKHVRSARILLAKSRRAINPLGWHYTDLRGGGPRRCWAGGLQIIESRHELRNLG
jgi:hypothetical protein